MTTTSPATAHTASTPKQMERTTEWDIDTSHALAQFKVRHLMVAHVRGTLGPVTGRVTIDESDLSRSRVDVSIDARGLDTREPKRDEHLRSPDFFDVARYPNVTFRSTKVEVADGLKVHGELTIRGISRAIVLEVEELAAPIADPWGNTKRGATARATIDRRDWGLVWNAALETGGFVVGDKVQIEIEVELAKRAA